MSTCVAGGDVVSVGASVGRSGTVWVVESWPLGCAVSLRGMVRELWPVGGDVSLCGCLSKIWGKGQQCDCVALCRALWCALGSRERWPAHGWRRVSVRAGLRAVVGGRHCACMCGRGWRVSVLL